MANFLDMLKGHRKMIMFLSIVLVAALVKLNEFQADVLKTVAVAGMGANAAVHIGEAVSAKMGLRGGRGAGGAGGAAGVSEVEPG